ncbi:type II secretion system F family protein [Angustibacter sp. McL0619]|uniref:type II secretion system F family protein n=1 Tax=Angustibacter sp. McL0619 TaxID=3415676 RepID=UPI003CEB144C
MIGPSPGWWVGAGLGAFLGCGLLLAVWALPFLRRPGLDERLAPYVQDVAGPSRLLPGGISHRTTGLGGAGRVAMSRLSGALDRSLGGSVSVAGRLDRAGLALDLNGFRAQQVLCGATGLAGGCLLAAGVWSRRQGPLLPLAVLVLACGAGGVAARDWYLSRQVVRRERRMLAEFPTVAEMLALAVGAGEGALAALHRVVAISGGELSAELQRTLADTHAGSSLVNALQQLSRRTGLAPLARFVDGVVVAVERGTPLAEVLRAQAEDVRQLGQRSLMDAAGRKEVAMMVPVVFGVLPVTVLFAVYPGFAFLRTSL